MCGRGRRVDPHLDRVAVRGEEHLVARVHGEAGAEHDGVALDADGVERAVAVVAVVEERHQAPLARHAVERQRDRARVVRGVRPQQWLPLAAERALQAMKDEWKELQQLPYP